MDEIKVDANELEKLDELKALKEENEKLKTRNAKLYRDCVSFAKKIKANENSEVKIKELEQKIESLNNEIAMLRSSDNTVNTPVVPVIETQNIFEDDNAASSAFDGVAYSPETVESYDPDTAKNHKVETKKSGFRIFIRTILWIFFIIALLISLTSGVTYLFSTTYQDYAVAGYRFATVTNNAMTPQVDRDSVILVKYQNFDGIPLDSLVVTTKDGRSVGKITALNVAGGTSEATIKDKNGSYNITENQFVGKVAFKIPYIGKIVQYASANPYNYLAIVVSSDLVLLALLLLIPAKKNKNPKFGKDYTVEDFTI